MRFNEDGSNEAQVLIEVDDFIVSSLPEIRDEIRGSFQKRFHFGKWEDDEAEYAGRMIRVQEDRILVDHSPLTEEEFNSFRTAIYKINWVAKESRPEMSGLASIMASKLRQATVGDAAVVNKNINHLHNTAARPLTIWRMDSADLSFVAVSDAGGVGAKHDGLDEIDLPTDSTQGAWMVLASDGLGPQGPSQSLGLEERQASPQSIQLLRGRNTSHATGPGRSGLAPNHDSRRHPTRHQPPAVEKLPVTSYAGDEDSMPAPEQMRSAPC